MRMVKITSFFFGGLFAGIVQNVYEAVDVLALIQDEAYDNLRLMVKDALFLRSDAVHSQFFRQYF